MSKIKLYMNYVWNFMGRWRWLALLLAPAVFEYAAGKDGASEITGYCIYGASFTLCLIWIAHWRVTQGKENDR
jgi:predicted membrane channel-forming protein YqfA (hemolysin III family)